MARTSTYNIWAGMIQRCHNHNAREYPKYGARGIKVCDRWRESFASFLADMGERPDGMSIDRIDNDGDYEQANCRWASSKTQSRNKRTNVLVFYKGLSLPISEWAEKLGIKRKVLERRIRDGWPVDRAFSKELYGRWGAIKRVR